MERARSLRNETALNSITPERAGGIMYDTLAYINEQQLDGSNPLLISKIYDSVADMEADPAPVSDLDGTALVPGQIVCIVTGDPDDPEDGLVYRYDGTEDDTSSWTAVGRIGSDPYMDGYLYMGKAVLSPTPTDPGTPTNKVFYVASAPGTYENFDNIVVNDDEVVYLKWDGSGWLKDVTGAAASSFVSNLAGKMLEMTPEVHRDQADRYIETTAGTNFGKWRTGSSLSCRFYSVAGIGTIRIVANGTNQARYALLKSDLIVNNQLADFATGETINTLAAGTEVTITVPSDAVYLYVFNYSSSNVYLPSVVAAVFGGYKAYFDYLFAGATKYVSARKISNDGYYIEPTGNDAGKWKSSSGVKSKFYDISAVDTIAIKANSSNQARFALLTSTAVSVGSMASFATGTTITILPAGTASNIVRPADAKYLYVFQGVNNTTAYEPEEIVFSTRDLYSAINNDFIKPLDARVSALEEKVAANKAALLAESDLVVPNLHIAVDDCISCFYDLVTEAPASIYDNAFFAQMKALHDTYGVKITLRCFLHYTGAGFDTFRLSDMPNTWAAEFVAAKSWLRFAFHGADDLTFNSIDVMPYYTEFVNAIYGMTGDYGCIDDVILTQSFTGSLANVKNLMAAQHAPVLAFVGGWEEGGRTSYYLDQAASNFLVRHGVEVDNENNVLFFRSYPYLDDHDLAYIQSEYNKYPVSRKYVEIAFHLTPSHSSIPSGMYAKAEAVCGWFMNTKGYDSNFLSDILR